MKKCPVCSSVCFDDMETCFGCMHRFADAEGGSAQADGEGSANPTEAIDVVAEVPEVEEPPASLEPVTVKPLVAKNNPQVVNAVPLGAEVRYQLVIRLEPVLS